VKSGDRSIESTNENIEEEDEDDDDDEKDELKVQTITLKRPRQAGNITVGGEAIEIEEQTSGVCLIIYRHVVNNKRYLKYQI
jgi:hypothetical protein